MKIPNRLFLITTITIASFTAWSQQKKMPKIKNPSGQGFIPCGSCEQPSTISFETTIAQDEPGERLTLSGTIFKSDGKTPAPDIILFFYHTDATGHYNPEDDPNNPRLKGWVKTNALGQYVFHTLKPAPYPTLKTPAHIHVHLFSKELAENWIDDFWFEGDRLIKESDNSRFSKLGEFSPIVKLVKGKNGLTGVRNIKLK
ncbi:MAG: hypothetical protein JSS79_20790 [Bacteroidetes bacterium]|nr:hypothetical protein [Bacteroidota bacterium]